MNLMDSAVVRMEVLAELMSSQKLDSFVLIITGETESFVLFAEVTVVCFDTLVLVFGL